MSIAATAEQYQHNLQAMRAAEENHRAELRRQCFELLDEADLLLAQGCFVESQAANRKALEIMERIHRP